jgi:hypothetical protein
VEKPIYPKPASEYLLTQKNLVEIAARDKYGKLIWVKNYSNIVVNIGRTKLAQMLAEGVCNPLVEYAWGDQGHNPTNPAENIPAGLSDVSLNHEVLRKPISTIQYPEPATIRLIGIIEPTEIVGTGLSEQGLFLQDHVLFARVTYPLLYKGAVQLEFRWTIHI